MQLASFLLPRGLLAPLLRLICGFVGALPGECQQNSFFQWIKPPKRVISTGISGFDPPLAYSFPISTVKGVYHVAVALVTTSIETAFRRVVIGSF